MSATSRILGRALGLPPVRTPRIRVERDLPIPAGAGVDLLADRYYPVTDPRAPLVLIRTPYGRGSANRVIARLFAERGYQVLIQALRGTDGSGGEFDGFVINRDDGPATIDWLRQQDWFPGAFATCGASYLGYTQWDLAATVIPEWKAAIIDVAPSSFYQPFMYPGGVFAIGNALGWAQLVHSLFGKQSSPSTMSAFTATRRLNRACNQLPIADADRAATGTRIPYYQDWITHERYDDYWAQMDYRPHTTNLPPVVHLGGSWIDFFLPGQLDDHTRLLRDDARTVALLIGSAAHGRNMISRTYQRDTFAVLDTALRGRDTTTVPAVRLRITGRKHWRTEQSWPPPHQPTRWYLHPAGALRRDPAPTSPPSRYRYDPADPTSTTGGTAVGLRAGTRDNRAIERRADVLTFTSDPLPADLTVIGPVTATIHLRSSRASIDVFVRLCDVHRRGGSFNISDGIQRLHSDDALADDGIHTARISLWPIGHVFRRGHRIRIQVSSGAHPRFNRNPGTGEPLATATRLHAADQELFHNPDHHSAIDLPTVEPIAQP